MIFTIFGKEMDLPARQFCRLGGGIRYLKIIIYLYNIFNLKYYLNFNLIIIYYISPRSPTARVYIAVGGNIIWNPIPINSQVQRRWQRAVAARTALLFDSVVMGPRRVQSIALNNTRSLTASAQSSCSTIQGGLARETRI